MSRYEIPALDEALECAVGWDKPLETFFGQVLREVDGEEEDVFWVGATYGEVKSPEALQSLLEPYARLDDKLLERLRADRAADLDRGPTELQRHLYGQVNGREA